MNNLQVIDEREVLGVDFKIYGDFENPLFLAKDVADWIGHSNVSKMVSNIDEEEKEIHQLSTLTNGYSATFLTEDGLYEVLMQSRKPIAKQFKKQVKIILKELRKGNINIIPKLTRKQELQLAILNGNELERISSLKEYEVLITKPLIDKIEEDKPKVALAETRLDKGKCISITDATKSLKLKRGQITKWAKSNGYIHKTLTEINKKGEDYFKIYETNSFKCIGITEEGLKLINDNLEDIKNI